MKKILLTLTAVLALALTGCAGSTQAAEPVPIPTVTVTAEPTAEPGVLDMDKMSEPAFLRLLRGEDPSLNAWEDEQIMDHAERVCVELDSGVTVENLIEGTLMLKGALYDSGYGAPLGTVIAGTVLTYCPQHSSQVRAATAP